MVMIFCHLLQISSIDHQYFRNCSRLQGLYLSHNQITHIHDDTFMHLTCLKYLDLNHNQLAYICVSCIHTSRLQVLMLNHNHLSKLDLTHVDTEFTNLKIILMENKFRHPNDITSRISSLQLYQLRKKSSVHETGIHLCISPKESVTIMKHL